MNSRCTISVTHTKTHLAFENDKFVSPANVVLLGVKYVCVVRFVAIADFQCLGVVCIIAIALAGQHRQCLKSHYRVLK